MIRSPGPRIYFIRPVGQDGPIKVGYSNHIERRLAEIGKWSPVPLEIVATLEVPDSGSLYAAPARLERRFHLRYSEYRLHHEWFAVHPLILADIDNINAGSFRVCCLPEWKKASNDFIRREYPNGVRNGHTVSRALIPLGAHGVGCSPVVHSIHSPLAAES